MLATNPAGTHTSPNLSSLTKNLGDLLIAIVITYDGNSTNAEFSGWGGSFTEFGDFATTTTMGIGCAYKWSSGSETGTFTVTSADTSANDSAFFLLSIPGAHGSTPPEAGSYATGTAAAADPASFNPAGWGTEDTLWIAVGGSGEDSLTGSYTGIASGPANYTDYADSGMSADAVGAVEGAVAFRQLNAASEDVGTFSVDTSNARNAALVIAVRPAGFTTQDVSGSVGASGTLARQTNKLVNAAVSTTSTLTRLVSKAVSSSLATAGSLQASKLVLRVLTATADTTASLTRTTLKTVTSTVATASTLNRAATFGKSLAASVATAASLVADFVSGGGAPVSGEGADAGSPTATYYDHPSPGGGADPGSPG